MIKVVSNPESFQVDVKAMIDHGFAMVDFVPQTDGKLESFWMPSNVNKESK